MISLIKRPSFLPNPYCPDIYPEESKRLCKLFHDWFDTHIKPINKMLSEGVELTGVISSQYTAKPLFIWNDSSVATHTALLINITPIKRESAEDVIREMLDASRESGVGAFYFGDYIKRLDAILERPNES